MLRATSLCKQSPASVEKLSLFSEVSPSDCTAIVSAAREEQYDRGQMLFVAGDPVRQTILLLSGGIKITQISLNGAEVILRLIGPGEIVGIFGLCHGPCDHCSTAEATRPCVALAWETSVFEEILERFPAFRRNLNRALEARLLELEQRFREISTEKVSARVSSQLVRLSNQVGRVVGDGHVEIGVSRADLAQLTGTTLFTVSRLLCEWKLLGIVLPRREAVVLRDLAALRHLAESEQ